MTSKIDYAAIESFAQQVRAVINYDGIIVSAQNKKRDQEGLAFQIPNRAD
ncbi:hypothetical protein [Vibrio sp. FJH11]